MLPDTLGILNPQMTFSYINDLCSEFPNYILILMDTMIMI